MDVTFINFLPMIPTLYKFVASLEPFIALLLLLLLLLVSSKEVCAQKKYSVLQHLPQRSSWSSSSKPKPGP